MPVRGAVYKQEFMEQFTEKHDDAFKAVPPKSGYPDDGNGFYSEQLSYLDWYKMNNAQRTQLNFLETFAPFATLSMIMAVKQTFWASIIMFVAALGRALYGILYCRNGPKGRLLGAIIYDLCLLALLIGAVISIIQFE